MNDLNGYPTSASASWRRGEARLGWALALPALGVIGLVAALSDPVDALGVAAPARPAHAVARPAVRRRGQLRRSAVGRAVLERARPHRRVRRGDREPRARRRSGAGAGAGPRDLAPASSFARPSCCRGRFRQWSRRSSGASCSRAPPGVATAVLARLGVTPPTWFADALAAWIPLVLADVWKTTPFVALLLLAGLQNIDRSLYEAADVDGAGPWRQFVEVTLPLLRPALLVALLFRTLDAFRVFDVVYVMTGGGPGTATEPIALYAFSTLLQTLRFGYGSALSVIIFVGRVRVRARQHPRVRRQRVPGSIGMRSRGWTVVTGAAGGGDRCSRSTGRWSPPSRPRAVCSRSPTLVPRALVLDHYRALFGGRDFWTPIRNSLIVAGATTVLSVVRWGGLRVRAGAAALPREGAGAGVRAGGLDVPADLDRVAAVPAAARAPAPQHVSRPGPAVSHLRDAARPSGCWSASSGSFRRSWRKRA